MSDVIAPDDAATKPILLLSADDYERLTGLARLAMTRYPTEDAEQLLDELYRANVVPSEWMPDGIVTMNSQVEYRDCTGTVRTVQLVYPHSADITEGRISVLSPVGTALIGLAEGQSITWRTRGGRPRRLTVLRVVRGPDNPQG